ncbi:MAG: hypothetical protein ACRDN9_12030 [Streptosporangiaceae bacterium]
MATGGVIGGALGSWLGCRSAVLAAVIGLLALHVWLSASPLRHLYELPDARVSTNETAGGIPHPGPD